MEDDFDLDNILDSINLTGQWQPSSMPDIIDPSLNSQVNNKQKKVDNKKLFFIFIKILDGFDLISDDISPSASNTSDDISSALIDTQMNGKYL